MWEPYIGVRAVQPVVAALETLGYDVHTILAQSAMCRRVLDDVDAGVPHRALMALWDQARVVTGDEHLGIHLAEVAPLSSFGVCADAILASPTLSDAYHCACRYQCLVHEVTDLSFEKNAHEGILRHTLPGGQPLPRHPAEFLVTLWLRFGRLMSGWDWNPSLVCFAHLAPSDTTEHARVFRAPVQFSSGCTAMHILAHLLEVPNPRSDGDLVKMQLGREQAIEYLAASRLSIAEVGFLLGFSELSAFYRAFKRWTGKTPLDFRADALGGANSTPERGY